MTILTVIMDFASNHKGEAMLFLGHIKQCVLRSEGGEEQKEQEAEISLGIGPTIKAM